MVAPVLDLLRTMQHSARLDARCNLVGIYQLISARCMHIWLASQFRPTARSVELSGCSHRSTIVSGCSSLFINLSISTSRLVDHLADRTSAHDCFEVLHIFESAVSICGNVVMPQIQKF